MRSLPFSPLIPLLYLSALDLVWRGGECSVEVVLESTEGGYFLKQPVLGAAGGGGGGGAGAVGTGSGGRGGGGQAGGGEPPPPPPAVQPPPLPASSAGSIITTERFAVFQTSRPLAVRASYGPFSTKQTVPARSLVAEPNSNSTDLNWGRHLDLSAHLVTKSVERDWPVIRVVMHTGAEPGGGQRVCAVVQAVLTSSSSSAGSNTGSSSTDSSSYRLSGACSPDSSGEGMCLVELVVPWSWWPPLTGSSGGGAASGGGGIRRGGGGSSSGATNLPLLSPSKPTKSPPRLVSLSYSVVEPISGPHCTPKVMIQSLTPLGTVQLVPASGGYTTLSTDNHVTMLMPGRPLYPTSKIHIPTYVTTKPPAHLAGFMLRARVKSGLKVLGAELLSKEDWNMTVEINSKQSVATVTVINKQTQQDVLPRTEEVLVWTVEVAGGGGSGGGGSTALWQEGKLVWSVRYLHEKGPHHHAPGKHKTAARIHINKDDIHALIPISKNWEIVNSAILTGKQVSQGMKVVMVSHGGTLADVTLQASCHVPDDSVIKVSSSCSSVYVDGSEVRGSANATVVVSYGQLAALASFTVWMPELPVEVSLPDTRLSQVKGWRVPDFRSGKSKRSLSIDAGNGRMSMLTEDNTVDKTTACRLRYQQTNVEVYARFVAADHDSGRVSYLVNRKTWLRVTGLVMGLLRVSDQRIASLAGNILQGRAPGRTELQVVSAVSGRVLGAKEVRVLSDKVTISRLTASVVSGLQLAISPDTSIDNGYLAQASVTRKLTAQYQEGLLDMELVFSDGSTTSVSHIEREDYQLVVETERPEVVAFAPQTPMSQPRVIAVSPGRGRLLSVTLHPPTLCGAKLPLASAHAHVDIDFSSGISVSRPELVQNDGGAHREISADLHDILIGIPLKDEHNHEPTVQARQHGVGGGGSGGAGGVGGGAGGVGGGAPHPLSPLEIGMYVLLAGFCFAIVVFVVSCVVYASRFKAGGGGGSHHHFSPPACGPSAPASVPSSARLPPTSAQNAHDWVWLGRSTLHVTDNPMFHHHHHQQQINSFQNPNHIHLPSQSHHWSHGGVDEGGLGEECLPPPVPPHGSTAEYRPPVPPHRGAQQQQQQHLASGAPLDLQLAPPHHPQRKHHHHHHKRAAVGPARGKAARGTVVGNPLFYGGLPSQQGCSGGGVAGSELQNHQGAAINRSHNNHLGGGGGLDHLNLGMDYNQIMEYFDNLKESNA